MRITSGIIETAQKVVIYGPEGIGKSTFAAQFPDPLFIDVEGSTKHLDVKRFDTPENWTALLEEIRYVVLHPEVCATLVIDTADWAERLCIAHICAKASKKGIEDFGYGKGFTYLAEEFGNLLDLLTEVESRGVNVVLTAHAQIKRFEQPDEMEPYDRWELKLGKKTSPLVKEWADMVLFANYKTFAVKDDKGNKAKAQGGKRVLLTSHAPAWDAKNRHGLEPELPLEFTSIAACIPDKPTASTDTATEAELAVAAADAAAASVDKAAEAYLAASEPVEVPVTGAVIRLMELMNEAKVTEADVRRVVAARGYYPEPTAIEKYDVEFVEGVLIAAWPQVLEGINGLGQQSLGIE